MKKFFGRLKEMPSSLVKLRRCHDLETESVLSGGRTRSVQSGISASIDAFLNDIATPQRTPITSPRQTPKRTPLRSPLANQRTCTGGSSASFSNSTLMLPTATSVSVPGLLGEVSEDAPLHGENMRNSQNPSGAFLADTDILNDWRDFASMEKDDNLTIVNGKPLY